ncbi:uncharacterized protein LOC123401644 [Hordeum vulgare subsp. vulgare]|uniref:uncharacterized protein LOC123401644 n=1 Tax=Hordeum vulgare subsp. vulgare TaxID=112509 RepID=UPI001D1A3CBC|nr:uncharacterized protein LOC123401644 [Hordeum vulgare subsp. vulgare]
MVESLYTPSLTIAPPSAVKLRCQRCIPNGRSSARSTPHRPERGEWQPEAHRQRRLPNSLGSSKSTTPSIGAGWMGSRMPGRRQVARRMSYQKSNRGAQCLPRSCIFVFLRGLVICSWMDCVLRFCYRGSLTNECRLVFILPISNAADQTSVLYIISHAHIPYSSPNMHHPCISSRRNSPVKMAARPTAAARSLAGPEHDISGRK